MMSGYGIYSKDGKTLIQYTGWMYDSFIVPNHVTSIDAGAFAYNNTLKQVTITNDVTIASSAFYYCTNLESIVLPKNTTIVYFAFECCDSLSSIYYSGGTEDANTLHIYEGNNAPLFLATTYYYSETEPTEEGNFWRWVDGVPTIWE